MRGYSAPLVTILHHEGHLRSIRVAQAGVPSHGDDLLLRRLSRNRHQGERVLVIDVRVVLYLILRHMLHRMVKAEVDRSLTEPVEGGDHRLVVGRTYRTQANRRTVLEQDVGRALRGVARDLRVGHVSAPN